MYEVSLSMSLLGFGSAEGGLEQISSDHISETTWSKGLFFCVCYCGHNRLF